jgi:hypothetical protein
LPATPVGLPASPVGLPIESKDEIKATKLHSDLVALVYKWAKAGSGVASISVSVNLTEDNPIEACYSAYVEVGYRQLIVSQPKRATFTNMISSIEEQLK